MKIAVFGATGSVGRVLTGEALRRGHQIVAVTRARSRVTLTHQNLSVFATELDDADGVQLAVAGTDAVVISLADAVVEEGTKAVIRAMQLAGVDRVEVLTGFGTSPESRRVLGVGMRALVKAIGISLPGFRAKERQDAAIRASGLDFTIVQPPMLTNGPATGAFRHGTYTGKSILGRISRADLVAFMLDNLETGRYSRESVYVQR